MFGGGGIGGGPTVPLFRSPRASQQPPRGQQFRGLQLGSLAYGLRGAWLFNEHGASGDNFNTDGYTDDLITKFFGSSGGFARVRARLSGGSVLDSCQFGQGATTDTSKHVKIENYVNDYDSVAFSVTVMFQPTALGSGGGTSGDRFIVGYASPTASNNGWLLYIDHVTNKLSTHLKATGSNITITSLAALAVDTTYIATLTHNTSAQTLYLNSVKQGTGSGLSFTHDTGQRFRWALSDDSWWGRLSGFVGPTLFHERVLSDEEVYRLHAELYRVVGTTFSRVLST